ncbi:hypothetical protein HanIR_Chr02g0066971 [Helianthus annuus]|nr:hypothetical protein HanIR_Chr02g0066971 [Helianthus annuus]
MFSDEVMSSLLDNNTWPYWPEDNPISNASVWRYPVDIVPAPNQTDYLTNFCRVPARARAGAYIC